MIPVEHVTRLLHEMLADRDWNSKNEFQAETELRLRMQGLLQQVHRSNAQLGVQQHHGEGGAGGQGEEEAAAESGATAPPPPPHREPPLAPHEQNGSRRMKLSKRYASRNNHLSNIRSNQVELITMMLEALEQEHELLYHAFLFPVTEFVCERLDPANRESSREELFFEDLEKLPLEDVGKKTGLTVSGQLNVETHACALSDVRCHWGCWGAAAQRPPATHPAADFLWALP